jgi:tetratricopeptide (TPR) repeat protein
VGEAALARKDPEAAERAFRRSLELDPEQPVTLNNLGVALIRRGRDDEAMKLFESAARADPHDDLGRRNLASAARRFLAGGGWIAPVAAVIVLQLVARNLIDAKNIDGTRAVVIVLGCFLLVFVGMRLYTRGRESELSPATRALLRDERRRMRRRPWTWEPSSRWLPWPIALLFWTPPQVIATLSGLLLVAMLVSADVSQWSNWVPLGAVGLFTAFFVLRWRDRPSR